MRCIALVAALMVVTTGSPSRAQEVIALEEALARAGIGGAADGQPSDNPRVYGPEAEEEAARAAIEQARLRPSPELTFEIENIAGTGAFSGLQSTEFTLGIGQQIELGDRRGARIESAVASARLAGLRSDLAQTLLARTIRERYVEAVAAGQRVDLAEEIVARSNELARIARVLVEVGREPPLRAMQAEAALAEAQADLQAAEANDLTARQALAALWMSDGPAPSVSGAFPDLAPPLAPLGADEPLHLRIAIARTGVAEAEIARERSLAAPDPIVMAGVRRFEGSDEQAFILGISIPLPFGNRNQGNIAVAEARHRAAQADEAVDEADYRLEFERTRTLYLAAVARSATLSRSSLPQAEEALRLLEIGYRNGRFPFIEVLAAADDRDAIRENLILAEETVGLLAARLIWLTAQ